MSSEYRPIDGEMFDAMLAGEVLESKDGETATYEPDNMIDDTPFIFTAPSGYREPLKNGWYGIDWRIREEPMTHHMTRSNRMKQHTDYEIIKAAHDLLSKKHGYSLPMRRYEILALVSAFVGRITGWTIWTGGECPVNPNTKIEYMMLDGYIHVEERSQRLAWDHKECWSGNIVAYRIIEPDISELRGWCEVTEQDGDIAVMYAQEDGLSNYKNAATVTIKWEEVKRLGLKVRKLTPDDISDGD